MARLVTSGFEWRSLGDATTSPDGANAATGESVETTIVRTGSASAKFTGNSGGHVWTFPAVTLGTDCYARAYIYVPSTSTSTTAGPIITLAASGVKFLIKLAPDATLTLFSNITQQGSASPAIVLDAWNLVELRARTDTGALDQIEGRLEGVSFASASGLSVTDGQFTQLTVGYASGDAGTLGYIDDVAVNDSAGANQNTWPGAGNIFLMKPISDNAKGTGWTNDAAGASNFFDAVDNTPPVGIADTTASTGLHQIRNATSNANSNYDANLTTYTNAGVGAADTINVVVPIVATAAPVTTSSKQGTFGVSSNPAITNVALSATGTSGAFWAGATAATFPTGWKWSFGTTTYAPSVTLGNSPVARITQVTSSTRIAMVCAMGMYVDFTPAAVAAATFTPVLTMAPRIPTRRS